jgi:putative aldouronate transport system substrate-binding protein
MLKKHVLMLGLALALILSLIGCSGSKTPADSGSDNNAAASGSSGSASAQSSQEDLTPVTFTNFNAGIQLPNIDSNQTEIGKKLEEQTGVNWKMEFLVGDVKTKIGTMVASGDYPDVLEPDTELDKVLDAHGFIPLEDLIDKYAPNIKKVYEPYYNQMKADDGHIYILPFSAVVGDYIPDPNINQGAFWVQRRVLKEMGYPKIRTLDQYMDMIKTYMNNHKGEGLMFGGLDYDWRTMSITGAPMLLAGSPNDGGVIVDKQTMKPSVYADSDYMKKWLQKLNELNSLGMFDKTVFVDNYDQYLAKLTSGKIIGMFDYEWEFDQALQTIRKSGNDDLDYFPLPVTFDENTKDQYLDPPTFIQNRGIGITVSAKDPVRIIKFFNTLLEEQNQIMVQWGIEGETYQRDANGRLTQTKEQIQKLQDNAYAQKVGIPYFSYSWPMYGQGSTLSDGNSYVAKRQPEVFQNSITDADKNMLDHYGVKTYAELFAAPDLDRPWYPAWSISLEQGSPAQVYSTKSADLQKKWIPKIVLADPSDFENQWNAYLKEDSKLDKKVYEDTMWQLIKEKAAKVTGN